MITFSQKTEKGFTLVESLVAISVLMIAIASPMAISQKGLSTATQSKDQMIASFLAQDGLEAVKNIRDQIAVSASAGTSWLTGLDKCVCAAGSCTNFAQYCNIDTTYPDLTTSGAVKQYNESGVNPLKTNTDINGKFINFNLSAATASIFSRYINVYQSTDNPNEAKVNVRVSWNTPSGIQNVTITDFIYNYSVNL